MPTGKLKMYNACRGIRFDFIVSCFSIVVPCLFFMSTVASADPALNVVIGGTARQFGRDELLHRPDVSQVTVSSDVAYGKAMSYRAVPLAALLVGLNPPRDM